MVVLNELRFSVIWPRFVQDNALLSSCVVPIASDADLPDRIRSGYCAALVSSAVVMFKNNM